MFLFQPQTVLQFAITCAKYLCQVQYLALLVTFSGITGKFFLVDLLERSKWAASLQESFYGISLLAALISWTFSAICCSGSNKGLQKCCLSGDVIGLRPNAKNMVKTYSDQRGKSPLKFCVTSVTDTSTIHMHA